MGGSMRRVTWLAAVVPVVVLGACSSGDGPGDAGSTSSSVTTDARQWDPNAWVPTVIVAPEVLSEEERQMRRSDWLVDNARMADPPEVELIAWSSSYPEFGRQVAECLQEAGFSAVWDGWGGMAFDPPVPAQQVGALDVATHVCHSQYSLDPRILRDETEDQAALSYDYWDQYYIPCMEAQGHFVTRNGQPSREAFVAAYTGPDPIYWDPYTASDILPSEEQQRLSGICPLYPPEQFMYGM